jgi:transposase
MEDLPFAKASQVRTDALNSLILGVSMFLSNEGASKVLALLGVQISNDSIQRLYDRIEFVDNPDVEEVGIDDVAIRKGQTYATAIYDLKDHHLIALLEGRDAETLKNWLKNHQKIRLVARDRASAYATAINAILPDCIQVADRFHLLQNLLVHLKEIFKKEIPSQIYIKDGKVLDHAPEKVLKEKEPDEAYLATLHYDNEPPKNPDGSVCIYDNKKHYLKAKQYVDQAESRKKNSK